MFIHNFKYSLKTLFKNKTLIFWTFAFPLILATFFNMAFSNISNTEKLDIINIAIVDDDEFNNNLVFKEAFSILSDEVRDDRLFNTIYTTEEKSKELLDNLEIIGYLKLVNEEPKLTFNRNGIDQTIFKYVTEEIEETNNIIKNLSKEEIKSEVRNIDYESLYKYYLEMTQVGNVNLKNVSNSNLDYSMIEFYTLIAMTCMYGGILGMFAINQNLANMSNKGKRISVTPTKKIITITSSLLASYIVQLIGLTLLFLYTIFALKIDYGDNIWLILILALVGSLAGLSLGTFLGTVMKSNENTKTGILISVTMIGCFFSGMFGITMKYLIDKNIPVINKINPVSMITDGLYSLYYYDTLSRYWLNIISLLIFSFVLILISFISLRRQKYDSI